MPSHVSAGEQPAVSTTDAPAVPAPTSSVKRFPLELLCVLVALAICAIAGVGVLSTVESYAVSAAQREGVELQRWQR
jgi:hypothetical protein